MTIRDANTTHPPPPFPQGGKKKKLKGERKKKKKNKIIFSGSMKVGKRKVSGTERAHCGGTIMDPLPNPGIPGSIITHTQHTHREKT
jgi:hypothetical protein